MKRAVRWICLLIFLGLCLTVLTFLHTFTESESEIQYINWETSLRINEDGTTESFDPSCITDSPSEGMENYLFTATLPENLGNGYLLFEVSGLELSLSLNGEEIYRSASVLPENILSTASINIPLPENPSGELTMSCRVLDSTNTMFPPLLRFLSPDYNDATNIAYGNFFGIPSGAMGLALLLISGLFLLTITNHTPDYSLIPLILAAAGFMVHHISTGYGYYFLSPALLRILTWSKLPILTTLLMIAYLFLNHRRGFWRQFGITTAFSAVILLVAYFISLARNGYLSRFLKSEITALFQYGLYDNLLYWVTLWLILVCATLSAYGLVHSIARTQSETKALILKNKLAVENYRNIEEKMQSISTLRHEMNHQITAMNILYQKGNYEELGRLLNDLKQEHDGLVRTQFSENFTFNTLLQNIAGKASRENIHFEAFALIPKELSIPENDLCTLLMNMLDNALEACTQVKNPEERFIRFRAEIKNGFLAIQCENSFAGKVRETSNKEITTTKAEPEFHGFGIPQMSAIAQKYKSMLDISYTDEHVFMVQTALKLPTGKSA